jgi:hypothetical protein
MTDKYNWHLTFAGQYMQHNYYLYHVLDLIFKDNPSISGIVEIGTGHGALTSVLGLIGISKHIPVITVDTEKIFDESIFQALCISYYQLDCFSSEFKAIISSFISSHGPILFICDGGDKKVEFNYFAPMLKQDSIIAAHDWTNELSISDILHTTSKHCIPFLEDQWLANNVQFSMFKIINSGNSQLVTIITRHHTDRPNLLKRCVASVQSQTNKDFQHLVIFDEEHKGIPHANLLFSHNLHLITGEYVFVLDDDDVFISTSFVSDLHLIINVLNPDVILVRTSIGSIIYPKHIVYQSNDFPPGSIGSSCIVVRTSIFKQHIGEFKTTETPGDYNFIKSVLSNNYTRYISFTHYTNSPNLNNGKSEEEIESANRCSL